MCCWFPMARYIIALVVNRNVGKMTEWGRHHVNICTVSNEVHRKTDTLFPEYNTTLT